MSCFSGMILSNEQAETLMPLGGGVKPACSLYFKLGIFGLEVYKFSSLEENCVFPRPLWERARVRGQAGLVENKLSSLDEVFLFSLHRGGQEKVVCSHYCTNNINQHSSLFNPHAPLPEIRDFDPPTRGGLSLITCSPEHLLISPKDCRGAATPCNDRNKHTLHSSRFTLHTFTPKKRRFVHG